MEWITNNWYVIVLALVAVMFLFGHRSRKGADQTAVTNETDTDHQKHKSGSGCCH